MKPIAFVTAALALVLGLVAWRSWARREEPAPRPPPAIPSPSSPSADLREEPDLARIGSRALTAKRLALWKSIEEIRSGEPADDEAILLLEQSVKREIAERRFGIRPSATDLESTLRKLASDPGSAAMLARIEALFGGDHRAFLEEFISPAFVESELWARFCKDPDIHRASRASAEDLAAKARSTPRQFPTLGPPDGTFGRALIALSGTDAQAPPRGNPLPRLDALPIDLDALPRIPAGQLYPDLIDTPESFLVLRVRRQRSGFAEVETWTVPKVPYVGWLTDQARGMSRTIDSPELKARIDALDPDHWLRRVFP